MALRTFSSFDENDGGMDIDDLPHKKTKEVIEVDPSQVLYLDAVKAPQFSLQSLIRLFDALLISKNGEVVPVLFEAPEEQPGQPGWTVMTLWIREMVCELEQLSLK